MAPKELGHTLFSLSAVDCQQTESRSERDGLLRRVSDEQGVELSFDVPWEGFRDCSRQNRTPHAISSLQRSARVEKLICIGWIARAGRNLTLRSLQRFRALVTIRCSDRRIEIAVSSPRHHEDEVGSAIQGIGYAKSTFGNHWLPRSACWFGSSNRSTSDVTSWKRSLYFMATAHNQFSMEKGEVKNAFLQGTFDDVPPGELAAEPVPDLRKALNLRDDEILMLTKACFGLIDAPRRWWKSLVRDTQQLGWRSCRHEPRLMTWHVRGCLKGLMCSSRSMTSWSMVLPRILS